MRLKVNFIYLRYIWNKEKTILQRQSKGQITGLFSSSRASHTESGQVEEWTVHVLNCFSLTNHWQTPIFEDSTDNPHVSRQIFSLVIDWHFFSLWALAQLEVSWVRFTKIFAEFQLDLFDIEFVGAQWTINLDYKSILRIS